MSSVFDATTVKNISILGCGWTGLPLAKLLIEKGYNVKGSTTTPEKLEMLESHGIKPYLIKMLPEPEGDNIEDFLDADLLVVSVPPSRYADDMETFHPTQIKHLIKLLEKNPLSMVIYISSTSVYPALNKDEIKETEPIPEEFSHRAVLIGEMELMENKTFDTTVLRFGGLMGYDRIPGKYFQGLSDLKTAQSPVNFLHRDDPVGAIDHIISNNIWNETFNVVAPQHPVRKDMYERNAKDFGFECPTFNEGAPRPPYKTINSQKLIDTGFTFKYPDPLEFKFGEE